MEPSCGDGAISSMIEGVVAIEYDKNVCPNYALNMDFFDYDISNKFDSIIGNPPYVKFKDISKDTKDKLDMNLFDKRSNLYLFFIEKCIKQLKDNGELIFIVPRDFLKSTSSIKLNEFIYNSGTITDVVDYGDKVIFKGFNPNCIIFRFEKDNFGRKTIYEDVENNIVENRTFSISDGQLYFLKDNYNVNFNDIFFVKVGGVSGADNIFTNEEYGNMDFVCSETCKTGRLRKMIYNEINDYILSKENELRSRNIKKMTDDNWWKWGRDFYRSDRKRIYVNSKTRNKKPFFINDCKNYDGSVLAIFPKNENVDIQELCDMLNAVDWKELGFVCGGRYLFSQKSLENSKLPDIFSDHVYNTDEKLW
jgi:adenine-specific DNA-methyltransferase